MSLRTLFTRQRVRAIVGLGSLARSVGKAVEATADRAVMLDELRGALATVRTLELAAEGAAWGGNVLAGLNLNRACGALRDAIDDLEAREEQDR